MIKLYDVTLRDGAQTEGIAFSINDKVRIIKLLDEIGMSFIEGGWPGSNPKDTELYQIMRKEKLHNAVLVAFGSTRRAGNRPEEDPTLKALIESGAQQVNIFAKGWDFHVTEALKISLEENLELIYDSITYLKKYVPHVTLGVEHCFDGYKANPDYVKKIIKTAASAGPRWISLADTNGGCMPEEIGRIIADLRKESELVQSVHIHQDAGLALANTIKAIETGITVVHGTINGIGERCGMTDFCTLIPDLKLKLGIDCISDNQLRRLKEVATVVADCGGFEVPKYSPYVGKNAFFHKGGVHVDAVLKNPRTYNHIEPELVGNTYTTSVSELSGRANILFLASEYGIKIEKDDPRIVELLNFIKKQEGFGFQYDGAGASRFILFKKFLENYRLHIKIEDFTFSMKKTRKETDDSALEETVVPEIQANVKMTIGGKLEEISVTHKRGPIAALGLAVNQGLGRHYGNISERIKIKDFKIRVLDYTYEGGNIHKLRVLLGTTDLKTGEVFYTVGASHDIYSAFLKAYIDGLEYMLIKNL